MMLVLKTLLLATLKRVFITDPLTKQFNIKWRFYSANEQKTGNAKTGTNELTSQTL
ncbi:hypothetical protein [Escherichia coli]|uniref:hypothetical protein n=1 Tax=Escherichia coli TaxID=562 RepID=UPI00388D069B